LFFVSVPVLSVSKKLTFAKSSRAERRLTITFFVASARTPNSIIKVITVGKLIGIPAMIRLKSSVRSSKKDAFLKRKITVKTTTATRLRMVRNLEILIMSFSRRLHFITRSTEKIVFPKLVFAPVAVTSITAIPLAIKEPEKTGSFSFLSFGNDSPVRADSFMDT